MTTLTATERGDLAQRLIPIAAILACLVHGDGGPQEIRQTMAQLDHDERDALVVVLAALVNPDLEVATALRHVTYDEHGHPAEPVQVDGTLRDIADAWSDAAWNATHQPNPGEPGWMARQRAIVEDTRELALQGCSREHVTMRLGVAWDTVTKAHSRCKTPIPDFDREIKNLPTADDAHRLRGLLV